MSATASRTRRRPTISASPALAAADAAGLDAALERAFAAAGPTVIEARIDPAPYFDTVFD